MYPSWTPLNRFTYKRLTSKSKCTISIDSLIALDKRAERVLSRRPRCLATRHGTLFCLPLLRQVCNHQAHMEMNLGNNNKYVNVQFDWFKSVQMPSTDPSFRIDFFHLLVQVHSQDSLTNQGQLEASLGIHYRYINVQLYRFKWAQMSLTNCSFQTLCLSPIGTSAPSRLQNR
jgi:hypothetical protein